MSTWGSHAAVSPPVLSRAEANAEWKAQKAVRLNATACWRRPTPYVSREEWGFDPVAAASEAARARDGEHPIATSVPCGYTHTAVHGGGGALPGYRSMQAGARAVDRSMGGRPAPPHARQLPAKINEHNPFQYVDIGQVAASHRQRTKAAASPFVGAGLSTGPGSILARRQERERGGLIDEPPLMVRGAPSSSSGLMVDPTLQRLLRPDAGGPLLAEVEERLRIRGLGELREIARASDAAISAVLAGCHFDPTERMAILWHFRNGGVAT